MRFFDFEKSVKDIEYYEILDNLMERWEYELVEFKEAKSNFDTDKIGRYFSAISNEANLRQQQYGWLIFGVSEENNILLEQRIKRAIEVCWKNLNTKLPEILRTE